MSNLLVLFVMCHLFAGYQTADSNRNQQPSTKTTDQSCLTYFFEEIAYHSAPYISKLVKLKLEVDASLSRIKPLDLIFYVLAIIYLLVYVRSKLRSIAPHRNQSLKSVLMSLMTRILLKVPYFGEQAQQKISETINSIKVEFTSLYKNQDFITELPDSGMSEEQIFDKFAQYQRLGSIKWREGRVSGGVYADQSDISFMNTINRMYASTAYTNPLHADVFPEIRKMEAEIVRMACNLFNGGSGSCGVVTTCGTESLVLVVKAYRDYAMNRKGIVHPEVVAPITAHPAFDKAAQLLNIRLVHVPIDPKTRKANMSAMKRSINSNTCLLVGSAPGFPYGIFDPIEEIAVLGLKYNIPVHVDSCLGGFLVPFVEKAGYSLDTRCDFSVPGVTSITADSHKYGYTPKGSSIVMYSDAKYLHEQYFVTPDWPGGIYASPTILGSRMGANIASCWTAMMYFGMSGYVEATRKILETTRKLRDAIKATHGLKLVGEPLLSVVAIESTDFDIFFLIDDLTKRGWNLNYLQFPSGFHICVTLMHTKPGVIDKLIEDIRELTLIHLRNDSTNIKCQGTGALYGMAQKIPDRSLISTFASTYLDVYYDTNGRKDPQEKSES